MKKVETQEQYDAAINRIEELYRLTGEDTPAGHPLMKELDALGEVVEQYENLHYPIAKPSLPAVIRLCMYEMGLTQKRLGEMLGVSPSRVSAYLHGRHEPSLKTARKISRSLNIEPDIVLGV